ncbi:MAG: S8 family serine peptidase, partial [Kiritimatiellae bacterium]|nr:S8 family serine peptidase [Kiritimatiellia bacterium]
TAPARAANGLTGASQLIACADTGLGTGDPDCPHPDLAGRLASAQCLSRPGDFSDPANHGTHVAGLLAGDGASSSGLYAGAAPAARLLFQCIGSATGSLPGLPDDLRELYDAALAAPVRSDSWGTPSASRYNVDSLALDEFVWDHPDRLVVVSAGNDGTDPDASGTVAPRSIRTPATAKNALAVGASESGRPPSDGGDAARAYRDVFPGAFPADPIASDYLATAPSGLPAPPGVAAVSTRGPTDDGRIKPDLLAPGTAIVSLRSAVAADVPTNALHPSTNYCFLTGTSMATPLVAGAAALLREYLDTRGYASAPSAALLKAALVGGARALSPGQYGTDPATREIPASSPTPVEGWGAADLSATLAHPFFAESRPPSTPATPPTSPCASRPTRRPSASPSSGPTRPPPSPPPGASSPTSTSSS